MKTEFSSLVLTTAVGSNFLLGRCLKLVRIQQSAEQSLDTTAREEGDSIFA